MRFRDIISDGSPRGVVVGTIHLTLIIAAYLSPFWLTWKVIVFGVVVLSAQFLILGHCLLNQHQYGYKDGRLYQNILTQLHIPFDNKRLRFVLDWIVPRTVLAIALIVQLGLHYQPEVRV